MKVPENARYTVRGEANDWVDPPETNWWLDREGKAVALVQGGQQEAQALADTLNRALDYEAASGEVTEEIMAAAWTAYCGSRGPGTAVAIRAVVDAVAPLLSAAARRKALEEAAAEARQWFNGWDIAAAIRALGRPA